MNMRFGARLSVAGVALALLAVACTSTGTLGTPGAGGTTGPTGTGGTSSCASGQTTCGTACVNTATDPTNCGACGIPCSTGQICQNSQCQCQAGLLDCNGACVASDASHCGSCTTVCPATQLCSNGACAHGLRGAQIVCGTACVNAGDRQLELRQLRSRVRRDASSA